MHETLTIVTGFYFRKCQSAKEFYGYEEGRDVAGSTCKLFILKCIVLNKSNSPPNIAHFNDWYEWAFLFHFNNLY